MIKDRSGFIKNINEKYKVELNLLEQIYILGKSMSKNIIYKESEDEILKSILHMACVRTISGVESIVQLIQLGNSADSTVIFRSIFDLLINILYVEKDIPIRSLVFARYEVYAYLMFLKRHVSEISQLRQKYEEEIVKRENEVTEYDKEIKLIDKSFKIPKGNNWSGKKIKEMAINVGLEKEYSVMYWRVSAASHSTGAANELYLTYNAEEGLSPNYYPNEESSQEITRATAYTSLRILNVIDRNLRMGKDRGIEQLRKKMERGFWPDGSVQVSLP